MGNSLNLFDTSKPSDVGHEVHRMPCRCAKGRPCPKPPIPSQHQKLQGLPRYMSRCNVYDEPFAYRVRNGRHKRETLDWQTFGAANVVNSPGHGYVDEEKIYPNKPGIGMHSKPYYRRNHNNIH